MTSQTEVYTLKQHHDDLFLLLKPRPSYRHGHDHQVNLNRSKTVAVIQSRAKKHFDPTTEHIATSASNSKFYYRMPFFAPAYIPSSRRAPSISSASTLTYTPSVASSTIASDNSNATQSKPTIYHQSPIYRVTVQNVFFQIRITARSDAYKVKILHPPHASSELHLESIKDFGREFQVRYKGEIVVKWVVPTGYWRYWRRKGGGGVSEWVHEKEMEKEKEGEGKVDVGVSRYLN